MTSSITCSEVMAPDEAGLWGSRIEGAGLWNTCVGVLPPSAVVPPYTGSTGLIGAAAPVGASPVKVAVGLLGPNKPLRRALASAAMVSKVPFFSRSPSLGVSTGEATTLVGTYSGSPVILLSALRSSMICCRR